MDQPRPVTSDQFEALKAKSTSCDHRHTVAALTNESLITALHHERSCVVGGQRETIPARLKERARTRTCCITASRQTPAVQFGQFSA